MILLPLGCWQETTTGERSPGLWFGTTGTEVPMGDILTGMLLQSGTSAVVLLKLHQPISPV